MNRQHIKNKVVIEKGRTTSLSRNVSLPKNDAFVMVNVHSASMNRKALTKFMIRIDFQEYFFIARSSLRLVDWSLCIAISISILWGLVNEIEPIVLVYYFYFIIIRIGKSVFCSFLRTSALPKFPAAGAECCHIFYKQNPDTIISLAPIHKHHEQTRFQGISFLNICHMFSVK